MTAANTSSDLRDFVEAVEILSERRLRIAGRLIEVLPTEVEPAGDLLVTELAAALYRLLYLRQSSIVQIRDAQRRRQLRAELMAANRGRGTFADGWTWLGGAADGRQVVEKQGVKFWVASKDVRFANDEPATGESCRVKVPAERQRAQTGFYAAVGDAGPPPPGRCLLRLYWALGVEQAVPWLEQLTSEFNQRRVPFDLKVLTSPEDFGRADAGVLYLDVEGFADTRPVIESLYRQLRDGLRADPPRLTAHLGRGLGIAEGTADGLSFGEHRCRLIAEGLASAFREGGSALERVEEAFRGVDLDPARPHLAAGSAAAYPPFEAVPSRAATHRAKPSPDPLETATAIGDAICDEAWWHGERCNWLARSNEEVSSRTGLYTPTLEALLADLYAGSSGVGLFLSELFRRTGDPRHRKTATGAMRQSLAELQGQATVYSSLGFYTGALGVAWAALRSARLLRSDELVGGVGSSLAGGALAEMELAGDAEHDLLSGAAGAIFPLLELWRQSEDERYLRRAEQLAERVCEAGVEQTGGGLAWPVPGAADAVPRCGLSHGTSGIAVALLEVATARPRKRWIEAARRALVYDDGLYDAEHRNWPDLRQPPVVEGEVPGRRFVSYWCHGAPGIALARLRAAVLDKERTEVHRAAAEDALATTGEALAMADPEADTSLCHGVAGLAEVAWEGGRVLGEERWIGAAEQAWARMAERHRVSGRWPSGVPSRGPNPSLMLGSAGLGYSLLRMSRPGRIPSILLPTIYQIADLPDEKGGPADDPASDSRAAAVAGPERPGDG